MTIDLVQVINALLDATDGLNAMDLNIITGLPEARCQEIINLRNELFKNRETWNHPDF